MPIDVQGFTGIRPVAGKELLPNNAAQVAENCRMEGGDLEAWKAPLQILALTSLQPVISIYRFDINNTNETQHWFQFTTDVDVVKGPNPGDTEERTYWTDGVFPKKANAALAVGAPPYPSASLRMGVPAPADAPTVTISGSATNPDDAATTAAWGYTYVTSWGEEGPMSPLSSLETWRPGQSVQISDLLGAPTGAYQITGKRLYRSNSGNDTTDLQFVADIPIANATFNDTVANSALGGVSPTRRFTPPPDNIRGLCVIAGDMLAAFHDNTVRLSEPGIPYAWPERHAYTFDAPIIGIKPFASALLVCTSRGTYILEGTDPASMNRTEVNGAGNCVSKRGMVGWMNGVVYPTTQGLQYVGTDGVKLLTESSFDEVKWAAFSPGSFIAAIYQNRYMAFYDTGVKKGCLIFTAGDEPDISDSTVTADGVFVEKRTGALYLVQTNNVRRWDGGTTLAYKWRSKEYRTPRPVCMAWGRVEADSYPVTFRWYAAGVLVHTETVQNEFAFPITEHDDKKTGAFEVEGTVRISRVTASLSIREMGDA